MKISLIWERKKSIKSRKHIESQTGENVELTVKRKIDGKYEDVKCKVTLGEIKGIAPDAQQNDSNNGKSSRPNNDDMMRQFQEFFDNYMN